MVLTSDENVSPYFEKGVREASLIFFNGKPYLVTSHWKNDPIITGVITLLQEK